MRDLKTSYYFIFIANINFKLLLGLMALTISIGPVFSQTEGNDVKTYTDVITNSNGKVYSGHEDMIYHLKVDHDGTTAVASDQSGLVTLWGLKSQQKVWQKKFDGRSPMHAIDYSSDSQFLVLGGRGDFLNIYSTLSGEKQRSLGKEKGRRLYYQARFINRDKYVLSLSYNGSVHPCETVYWFWHEEQRRELHNKIYQVVDLWDAETGEVASSVPINDTCIHSMGVSFGRNLIYTASFTGIQFMDLTNGDVIRHIDIRDIDTDNIFPVIAAAAVNDRFQFIAIATLTGIYVFDAETGELGLHMELPEENPPHMLAFTKDGCCLTAVSFHSHMHTWAIPGGQHVRKIIPERPVILNVIGGSVTASFDANHINFSAGVYSDANDSNNFKSWILPNY